MYKPPEKSKGDWAIILKAPAILRMRVDRARQEGES